jgi:uncharacterized protein (TIGR02145 family)
MKKFYLLIQIVIIGILINREVSGQTETGTVTDYDGNVYNTIKVGNQWWMAENLKVKHFNDGTAIPYSSTTATTSADDYKTYRKYPNNDSLNIETYGMLYSWNCICDQYATTMKDLCPSGWEVPDTTDWGTLTATIGKTSTAGGMLKSTTNWTDPNTGASNSYGFNALPAGDCNTGGYTKFGIEAHFWTPQLVMTTGAGRYYILLTNTTAAISKGNYRNVNTNSIRCFKDVSGTSSTMDLTDNQKISVIYSPVLEEISLADIMINSDIFIFSANGRLVKQYNNTAGSPVIINVSDLSKGVYLVSAKNQGTTKTIKFLKY